MTQRESGRIKCKYQWRESDKTVNEVRKFEERNKAVRQEGRREGKQAERF